MSSSKKVEEKDVGKKVKGKGILRIGNSMNKTKKQNTEVLTYMLYLCNMSKIRST